MTINQGPFTHQISDVGHLDGLVYDVTPRQSRPIVKLQNHMTPSRDV